VTAPAKIKQADIRRLLAEAKRIGAQSVKIGDAEIFLQREGGVAKSATRAREPIDLLGEHWKKQKDKTKHA
jgi:hypothetical protein